MNTVTAHSDRDLREMLDWAITQTPVNIALVDTEMRQLRLNASLCRTMGLEDEARASDCGSRTWCPTRQRNRV